MKKFTVELLLFAYLAGAVATYMPLRERYKSVNCNPEKSYYHPYDGADRLLVITGCVLFPFYWAGESIVYFDKVLKQPVDW